MASDPHGSHEPELAFIRDALATFCQNAKEPRHAAVWAESILGSFSNPDLKPSARPTVDIRLPDETWVTRIRSEFDGNGTIAYDADIHMKMQAMLEEAFSHYNRG